MDNPIITELLKRGFGSMNKNDYEVLIIKLLRDLDMNVPNSIQGKTTYAISKQLRIPESKVKRLLYEADLCYPPSVDTNKEELQELLQKVRLLKDEKTIKFTIKKKILRQYIADVLAEDHRFMDSSFNSEIVTISIGDLIYLFEKLYQEESSKWIKSAKERAENDEDFPTDMKDILKSLALKLGEKVLGEAGDRIVDFSFNSISKYINKKS